MRAGASGYILKDLNIENIGNAVKELYAGGVPLSPAVARKIISFFQQTKSYIKGISPDGDGINDILVIDGITAYPENKLLIMKPNGSLVFETSGYNNSSRVFDGHSNKTVRCSCPALIFICWNINLKLGPSVKPDILS